MSTSLKALIQNFKRKKYDFITKQGEIKHEKQDLALKMLCNNNISELLYGGSAGGAKSWTGCTWLLFMSLCYPGIKSFIGREELKRLRSSTLITFYKVCAQYGAEKGVDWKYNGQDHYIEFTNGSRIDLLDLAYVPSDPLYERYGSSEYTIGFVEEGGEVNFGAFDTLKTRVGRHMNKEYGIKRKILITANPKKNWMYSEFYKPWKEGKLKEYQEYLPCLVTENPFIDPDYIEGLKSTRDEVKKQRLLYGNWDYDDDPAKLIDYIAIMDMYSNDFALDDGKKYISADIAGMGSDLFVIGVWSGYHLIKIISMQKSDGKQVLMSIKQLANQFKVPVSRIVYDADGIGSFLGGWLHGAVRFNNGGRAFKFKGKEEQYANLKTQCAYKLAEKINGRELYVTHVGEEMQDSINQELSSCLKRDKMDDDQKLRIISKEDMKELIGRSPDFLDMMLMRMIFEYKSNIVLSASVQ